MMSRLMDEQYADCEPEVSKKPSTSRSEEKVSISAEALRALAKLPSCAEDARATRFARVEAHAALKAHEESQNPLRLPWTLNYADDFYTVDDSNGHDVCGTHCTEEQTRLIAAAPELLELVRRISTEESDWCKQAATIIARIDGEE